VIRVAVLLALVLMGLAAEDHPLPEAKRLEAEGWAKAVLAKPASATAAVAKWAATWQGSSDLQAATALARLTYDWRFHHEQTALWTMAVGAVLTTSPDEQSQRRADCGLDIQSTVLMHVALIVETEKGRAPDTARRAEMVAWVPVIMPFMGWYLRWADPGMARSASAAAWSEDERRRFRGLITGLKGSVYDDILHPWLLACYRGRPDDRAELVTAMIRNGFPPAAQAELLKEIDQPWP